jgi:DNA-directed RNA polymerase subunit RPC12/RpoP
VRNFALYFYGKLIIMSNYSRENKQYKSQYICGDCCKSFKRILASDLQIKSEDQRPAKCPQCGENTILIGPDFEVPKSSDITAWKSIEVLARIGILECFGSGKSHVYIPKGSLELKSYLQSLMNSYKPIIHNYKMPSESLTSKSSFRNKIQIELDKLK